MTRQAETIIAALLEDDFEDEIDRADMKDVSQTLYFAVYDNFVDYSHAFYEMDQALNYARRMQEGVGMLGVVDANGNIVVAEES